MKLTIAVAAFAALLACAGAAGAETINCPLSQATRTISNTLPEGWWTTPIVSTLTETKIVMIGGKPALMCVYGASGSVQRDQPAVASCTAKAGGFECTPTLTIAPGVFKPGLIKPLPSLAPITPATFKTGLVSIPQTFTVDLDTGVVGGGGADLWFEAETADLLYVAPRSGATMWTGDRSNCNYAGCAAGVHYTPDRVSLADLPVGSYVCVKTNEGRVSQFRVNALSAGSPKTLQIGYTTWAK